MLVRYIITINLSSTPLTRYNLSSTSLVHSKMISTLIIRLLYQFLNLDCWETVKSARYKICSCLIFSIFLLIVSCPPKSSILQFFDQPHLSFLLGKGRNKIILIISFLFSIFLVFYFLNPSSTASFLFLNWTHFIDIKANSAHNKQSKNSSIHSYELF